MRLWNVCSARKLNKTRRLEYRWVVLFEEIALVNFTCITHTHTYTHTHTHTHTHTCFALQLKVWSDGQCLVLFCSGTSLEVGPAEWKTRGMNLLHTTAPSSVHLLWTGKCLGDGGANSIVIPNEILTPAYNHEGRGQRDPAMRYGWNENSCQQESGSKSLLALHILPKQFEVVFLPNVCQREAVHMLWHFHEFSEGAGLITSKWENCVSHTSGWKKFDPREKVKHTCFIFRQNIRQHPFSTRPSPRCRRLRFSWQSRSRHFAAMHDGGHSTSGN